MEDPRNKIKKYRSWTASQPEPAVRGVRKWLALVQNSGSEG